MPQSNGHHSAPVNLQLQVAWQTGHKEQDPMECSSFIKTQIIKGLNKHAY